MQEINEAQQKIAQIRINTENGLKLIAEMDKYRHGKIYGIYSSHTDKVYYGSTFKSLNQRLAFHKYQYNQYQNNNSTYMTSFEIVKYDDHYIELLEDFPCNSKQELQKHEGKIILQNKDAVNKNIAGRTRKEYKIDKKNEIRNNKKEYYKKYKQIFVKKRKQYQQENSDRILEHANQKHICACGGRYTLCHKSQHIKTSKHKQYFKDLVDPSEKLQ